MTKNKTTKQGSEWQALVLFLKKEAEKQKKKPYHIAIDTGFSPSTITRVFQFKMKPNIEVVVKIAKSLNCEVKIINL